MKRSINNQLVTQISFAMILHNVVSTTSFTWRIIFGPTNPFFAVFESYFANLWSSLTFLLLTEMSVIKTLLVFKWSWIVGVDEQFASRFSILLNLGYILISQTARFVFKRHRQGDWNNTTSGLSNKMQFLAARPRPLHL